MMNGIPLRKTIPPQPEPETQLIDRVWGLMGGAPVLGPRITSPIEAHELLLAGLPGDALHHLVDNLLVLDTNLSLASAVGLSRRTFQRSKVAPSKPLSVEQSGRAWKFAEILSRATDVFGSQEDAERWLERPAIGLDQRRPIDLLATTAGVEIVETFLRRLEHGVYT